MTSLEFKWESTVNDNERCLDTTDDAATAKEVSHGVRADHVMDDLRVTVERKQRQEVRSVIHLHQTVLHELIIIGFFGLRFIEYFTQAFHFFIV